MKLNLFLSVLFTFTIFHFSKAGPLRLQKRAAFYIANETACVVDNIVYSNGEPIPTDDPCESCKCRPPGFACVLVDCKVKPGCKAVRRAGQCCPEYICGCEHNGRMYADGEEIRDPKNPCYECHCQGSSIACAFVDCIFRDDCEAQYTPGQCCPEYRNCTRDPPQENNFFGGNILPSANLLPSLNDESILPGELPSVQTSEPSPRPADPTEPPTPSNYNEEVAPSGSKESVEIIDNPQTNEPATSATEESKSDSSIEETSGEEKSPAEEENSSSEEEKPSTEEKKEGIEEKATEVSEEVKTLFNSETEVNKEVSEESTEEKIDPTQSSVVEQIDQKLQTTVANVDSEVVSEAETTEKPRDESISTETLDSEKQVKNSAAENSKSLKLSDDQTEEPQKKEIEVATPEKTVETLKTEIDSKPDTSETPSVAEESSTEESEAESRENVPEESQLDPKVSSVNSNEKIKSETAETVTIVVNVREKTELPTEEKLVTEAESKVTSLVTESVQNSSELKDPESREESTETTTGKNFEIFPSSTDANKNESIINSPSTEQGLEVKVDKTESTTLEAIKENVSEIKNEDSSIAATTQSAKDIDVSKEARTSEEEISEEKKEEPTITVIRINPNAPIKIEIITDPLATTKIEEQPTKDLGNTEEPKVEDNTGIEDEAKEEEKVTEAVSEVREEPEKETLTEKIDETKEPTEKVEESPSTEKVGESSSTEKVREASSTEKIEESPSTEKVEELVSTQKAEATPETSVKAEERTEEPEVLKNTTERVEIASTEKSKIEDSTSISDQETGESKPNDTSSDKE